jgi:hypothetical protein
MEDISPNARCGQANKHNARINAMTEDHASPHKCPLMHNATHSIDIYTLSYKLFDLIKNT